MDKKFIITCFTTGIITTILTSGLFISGVFLFSFFGALIIPSLLFGLVMTRYFSDITFKSKLIFTSISFIIYLFSAFTSFYLNAATNYIALVLLSTFTLPLITIIFDNTIKKSGEQKSSILIALIGGCLSGLIIYFLQYLIKIKLQGENAALALILVQFLIFPFWQFAFALSVKIKKTN